MKSTKTLRTRCLAVLSTVVAVSAAAPAAADTIPKGWGKIATDCFEAALPVGWEMIRRAKPNEFGWAGAWGWESRGGRIKMYVRCSPLVRGKSVGALMAASEVHLKKRFKGIERQTVKPLTDAKGRPLAIAVYGAKLKTRDPATKTISETPFVVIRVLQLYPGRGLKMAVTYAFTGLRAKEAEKFVTVQSETIDAVTKEEMVLVAKKAAQMKLKTAKGKK